MSREWVNFTFALREIFVHFHLCFFSGPRKVPVANFGGRDISTEAETKRQRRSRRTKITRRLVPLAQDASVPIDFLSRDINRTLLEQAFDDGMYQLK